MTISARTPLKNARLDAITADVGPAGLLRIYSGVKPATVNVAITSQVLLAELVCGSPFAPGASSGVLTANAIANDPVANNSGTASFYQLCTSAGVPVVQGDVGTSGQDLNLNTLTLVAGGPVAVSSFTYTEGN